MKICFYTDSIFTFGGVQRVLAVVAKALSEKHDITILTMDDPSAEDLSMYDLNTSNIRYHFLKYQRLSFWEYLPCKTYSFLYKYVIPQTKQTTHWYGYSSFQKSRREKLIQFVNQRDFDVVIAVHAFFSFHLVTIRNKIKGKIIGWMHNSFDAFFKEPNRYLWKQEKRFCHEMPLLDDVVVLTNYDKEIYKEKMHLNTTVIYNPLTITPKGKGSPEKKKFLSIGRLYAQHKGFDILIKAFAIFAQNNTDWTLDIVGEGPDEDFLRSMIHEYKLEDRIMIYPFTNQVQKHYASSSVFVLSSRWEGFGLVLIEAMSSFLPVIATDLPVIREIIGSSNAAVFFEKENELDLAEKMLSLANSEELNKTGVDAFKHASKFSLPAICKQWEDLLLKQVNLTATYENNTST